MTERANPVCFEGSGNENKLPQYGTDGRLFTTNVSAKFKVT